ncbi:MAG: cobalamin-binding protein [Vicinamibacterales bacterium]
MTPYPSRIVCLTEETTETLYMLGAGDRVVGVSGYTMRPPEARNKPRVSAFINARFEKIEALKPDLVLGFSDLQADIAAELIRRGLPVMVFNQRSVSEILQMIRVLGSMVGRAEHADRLAWQLECDLERIRESAARFPHRPLVYFEEWDEPLISGIQWVDELVEIAGGDSVFPELRGAKLAKDRTVTSEEVIERNPEVILASWCGKPVRMDEIHARDGWDQIEAIRNSHVYEVKSTIILQPGPASLTDGVRKIHSILRSVMLPG